MYQQITSELKRNRNQKRVISDKRYHKYAGHKTLGIQAAVRDGIFKKYKNEIKALACREVLALAGKLYAGGIEEFLMAGNYVLQIRPDCLSPREFSFLDRSLEKFISWSTTDNFCIDVLQPLLLKYRKDVIFLLQKWNKSKNVWKRRASVVAFTRSAGESGKYTEEALKLCENLVACREDLVQKSVGWALKDILRGDKKRVLAYIKRLKERGVSSAIILYSIRDLPPFERKKILLKR